MVRADKPHGTVPVKRYDVRVRRAPLFGAAAALLSLSVPAAANGRFPASNQIVFSPSDKNLIVMRGSYGLLPSHDNGTTWGFVCEDALGLGPPHVSNEDPSIGLTENNTLLAGDSVGLDLSTDVGCNWSCIKNNGLEGQFIVDLAVRPDNPASAVAMTRAYVTTDAGQTTMLTQVYETLDNGATWTPVGVPIDPNFVAHTIDVAKGDANRLYVSGTYDFETPKTAALIVSTDKGTSWTPQVFPPAQYDPGPEESIYIGAVDPSDIDRVYVRSNGNIMGGWSRLTVVTSASTTAKFTTARTFEVDAAKSGEMTGELLGFALSPDGQKVYAGSQEDGLWVAAASDLKFTKKSSVIVQCLATRGSELWACSAAKSGFVVGMSTDDGAHFTSKLRLVGSVTGPIECPANTAGAACGTDQNASQCGPAYAKLCNDAPPCGPLEGGTTGDDPKSPSSSTCGCSFVGACRCGGGAIVAGSLALVGAAVRRRRKRK
jgi:hypothetical protein